MKNQRRKRRAQRGAIRIQPLFRGYRQETQIRVLRAMTTKRWADDPLTVKGRELRARLERALKNYPPELRMKALMECASLACIGDGLPR